jgi:ribonuclease HI
LESDRCTNNVAEYEAVILGLRKLRALGVTTCIIKTDSKVVVGQVEKDYAAKDPALMQYLMAVRGLERQFKGSTLQHVDRAKNEEADVLAKVTAKGEALPSDASDEDLDYFAALDVAAAEASPHAMGDEDLPGASVGCRW